MSSTKTLATFFGWCTVINLSFLLLAFFAWMIVKDDASAFAATLFGVTEAEVKTTFLRVLFQYRTGIVLLNLVPYISLKIMGPWGVDPSR